MPRRPLVYDFTPASDLLTTEGIGSTNIGLAYALGEIIANSLDWCLLSKEAAKQILTDASNHADGQDFLNSLEKEYGSLKNITTDSVPEINIEIKENQHILIVDSGVGMLHEEVNVAMQLKKASDVIRAPLRLRKGQFGMGLKTASKSLGGTLEIQSRSIKNPGNTVVMKLTNDDMRGRDNFIGELGEFGYETDEKETNSPLGDRAHGTSILISDLQLNISSDDILDALEELCHIFYYAIDHYNAKISVNGDYLTAKLPEMNPDIEIITLDDWNIFVEEDLGGGRRGKPIQVLGWAGLTKTYASGDLLYGFQTFRKGQLIERHHNEGRRSKPPGLWPYTGPHATQSRLYGHIHLDMVPPNFHKKGWNNTSPAWLEVVEKLKAPLEHLVTTSAKTKKDVKLEKEITGAWNRFAKTGNWTVPKKSPRKKIKKDVKTQKPEPKTPFNFDGYDYKFLEPIKEDGDGSEKPPWDYLSEDSSREIQIFVYINHPIWKKSKKGGELILQNLCQIDVFCQIMREKNYSNAQVQSKKEELYFHLFGGR